MEPHQLPLAKSIQCEPHIFFNIVQSGGRMTAITSPLAQPSAATFIGWNPFSTVKRVGPNILRLF